MKDVFGPFHVIKFSPKVSNLLVKVIYIPALHTAQKWVDIFIKYFCLIIFMKKS